MEKELSDRLVALETRVEERWNNHDKISQERNKRLCEKIDKIFEWLEMLPCKERSGFYKNVTAQLTIIWTLVSGMFLGVVVAFIRHFV